ncbi:hypothetical protein GF359_04170 [candidate division WOR-3 bacterium]|uniref:Aerotolerance regulator N-terminal domain-containing protein n=1 Tax=candidate division WOR-3 bacterium TaxID=2052148 RepID=A0A9D5QCC2_UNCW3|nr:hypothetical protein [candidate division WOR-3 bacterium]MBD3364394.1 hypothetical protein [candidate division WOR-3 bacterium]
MQSKRSVAMFSFASPWFLLLTPIALGPLVLHLLSRRKMRRTEFSSLFFLRKLRERRFRWLKLRDILLLILRTLFLAFLVLALSRPVWKGRFPVRLTRADLVLVLDDSYSTSARFAEITETAERLSGELTSGSGLSILTPSGVIWDTLLQDISVSGWETRLQNLQASQSGRDLEDAWKQALSMLEKSKTSNKRIAFVSDGQARALDFLKTAPIPSDIEVYCFTDRAEPPANVSILSTRLYPAYPLPGEDQALKVIVKATENNAQANLEVFTDSKLRERRTVSAGRESREFLFNLPQDAEKIRSEIDTDSIPADDRRFVHGAGAGKLKVALVAGQDSDLLSLGLRAGGGLEVRQVSASSAAGVSPQTHDLIVWDDVYRPSVIDAVTSRGLPVFVLLGEDAEDIPRVFRMLEESPAKGFEIMASSWLFSDLSVEDIREIKFSKYLRLEPEGGNTVLSFSGGDPMIIADTSRNIYYSAVQFTPEHTNLVYRAIFPVFIQRLATFAAGQRKGNEFYIGDTLKVRVPTGEPMFVETPELHYEITPKPADQGFLVEFANTQKPGFYTIGTETFVVNPDPRESSPEKIRPAELEERGIKVFPLGASTPVKLWLPLLILAAICLAAELLFIFL